MEFKNNLDDIIAGNNDWMSDDLLKKLSKPSLNCIEKEFPHFIYSVESEESFKTPKEQHPVFYGCFDWHSAVHSHWNLVRQVRLFEDHPFKEEIINSLDSHFIEEKIKKEIEYFDDNKSFEKPYGWAWFLGLMTELHLWDHKKATKWNKALKPLEYKIYKKIKNEFLEQERPLRVGTHGNSAFSLSTFIDYARIKSKNKLESKLIEKSRKFYLKDKDAPIDYEPIGWDFLSPTLTEADLMHRVLQENEYLEWLDRFIPEIRPDHRLLQPIIVELDELMKYHLVGLNLSKAWCLISITKKLLEDHRYYNRFLESAKEHTLEGLKQAFSEDYGGSHWLLSFTTYLFTLNEP